MFIIIIMTLLLLTQTMYNKRIIGHGIVRMGEVLDGIIGS